MIHSITHRSAIAVATAALLVPLASGCNSGLLSTSMTETADNPAAGDNAEAGAVLVRNAFVLGPVPGDEIPQGGSAPVYLTLLTRGGTDRLVGATVGELASRVQLPQAPVRVSTQTAPVRVGSSAARMTLRGLNSPLSGGETVRLTLRFERAGSATLRVPVLPRSGPYATLSPAATPGSPATQPGPGRTAGTEPPAGGAASPSPGVTAPAPAGTSQQGG